MKNKKVLFSVESYCVNKKGIVFKRSVIGDNPESCRLQLMKFTEKYNSRGNCERIIDFEYTVFDANKYMFSIFFEGDGIRLPNRI